jgi:uncharacterized membrane protein YbhN (UPF0104 family)
MWQKNSPKLQALLKYAKWLWTVMVIAAVGYYLVTRWDNIGDYFRLIPLVSLLLSSGFLIVAKLLLVYVSKTSVEKEGEHFPYRDAFTIVSFTHLAKYIPGGVWHFVGRFGAYQEKEFGAKKSTWALIHENVWMLSGALITGISAGALSTHGQDLLSRAGIDFPAAAITVVILLAWIGGLLLYERIFPSKVKVHYFRLLVALLLAWLFLGTSFGVILPGFSPGTAFFYISIYGLGWLVGYLAIFAPGGIGIRETALVWMLSGFVDPELAIIYSTVHRFVFILVEIILGGVSAVINLQKNKRE